MSGALGSPQNFQEVSEYRKEEREARQPKIPPQNRSDEEPTGARAESSGLSQPHSQRWNSPGTPAALLPWKPDAATATPAPREVDAPPPHGFASPASDSKSQMGAPNWHPAASDAKSQAVLGRQGQLLALVPTLMNMETHRPQLKARWGGVRGSDYPMTLY